MIEIDLEEVRTATLYQDNKSAMMLYHETKADRSKHIAIKIGYIKERILNTIIKIEYMNTSQLPADMLTKGLTRLEFLKHRNWILGERR